MKKYNIAVVGATGVVGRKMIQVLEERKIPVENLYPMASSRSAGKTIMFDGREWIIEELTEHSFDKDIDFALFSAGGAASEKFAPIAADHGVTVIDNSSQWRMEEDIPLVVPEVNGEAALSGSKIIANPNCSTIQAVVALKPIFDTYGIKRIVYSTYQSVSGAGIKGIEDLKDGVEGKQPSTFPRPIAFNVLPHIDVFQENGYTKEEMKMINETKKILSAPGLAVTATTVRVPVYYAHSESVNIETEKPFDLANIRKILSEFPGIVIMDDPSNAIYPTAIDAENKDEVFVGRIRRDDSVENGLNLWIVCDNIRKGAATNTVQIAEYLIAHNAFDK